jgi:hypothetical protein
MDCEGATNMSEAVMSEAVVRPRPANKRQPRRYAEQLLIGSQSSLERN